MKYYGKNDQDEYEVIDLDVQYPEGPTPLNIVFREQITPVIAQPDEVIVRLTTGGWPMVFTKEAFDASFHLIED